MSQPTLKALSKPEENPIDPLTEILRQGARDLISQAVEAELRVMLEGHSGNRMKDGRKTVVRNGYLPRRTVQTEVVHI